ncbi:hypothetical protein BCR34DRAFT_97178 [Clohesyomyces aquaticus]|uniref:BZIP domain-containing protein n=1 Tax=Clohesyomyces aquaticus TaxID=1231657 RepID=A0A1Y2A2U6_9PLEO|nr:hypothetical protein BCR34DRAFT_97178 [Clohesyomyces aquaticus]
MTSSESEGQAPSRKRSRNSSNEESGSKKARGRPRVDTQDATAADRRRTQIRLAQRAYRQRKETTISSLKQQNNQLQSIIEEMNKSFLRFNDTALQSGLMQLNPSLVHELKSVTENFVNLAKTAAAERSNDGDEELAEAGLDAGTESQKTSSARAPKMELQTQNTTSETQAIYTDIGMGYSATLTTESPTSTLPDSPHRRTLDHSTYFPPMPNSPYEAALGQKTLVRARHGSLTVGQVMDTSGHGGGNSTGSNQLPFGLILPEHAEYSSNPQIYSVHVPTPEVTPPLTRVSNSPQLSSISTKSPTPIYTYSHQETTFARRLTRATMECGFQLLSSATMRPAALNYVFKLSLPYIHVDRLREKFRLVLARGIDEDLDSYDTPFIHLGGAGTHYPKKDVHGNIVPIPNSWTVRRIGPMKRIRAQSVVDPALSHDLDIDLTGFEGEWFDGNDVEGYLKAEKGCYINPQDTFAEVFVDVDDDTLPVLGDLLQSQNNRLNLEFPESRRSNMSQSPPLSHSSSISTDTLSSLSTPGSQGGGTVFRRGRTPFVRSETPFGLDMGLNNFGDLNSKANSVDDATFFEQPLGLDLAPGFDFGLDNTSMTSFNTSGFGDMSSLGIDFMGLDSQPLPVMKQKRKKAAWVDISKLVDELIKHAVCLGRAPGFRRKDVDMAFKTALINF